MLDARLNIRSLHWWMCAGIVSCWMLGCSSADVLDDPRRRYQESGDYASLQLLAGHLKKGMSRKQTAALLGDSGYAPTDGQYMYGTDRQEFVEEDGVDMHIYLVLSFRDSENKVTKGLQDWGFAPLGE